MFYKDKSKFTVSALRGLYFFRVLLPRAAPAFALLSFGGLHWATAVSPLRGSVHPFSKITITSQSATCQKDANETSLMRLTYKENVRVTFADESTVTSDSLLLIANKNVVSDKKDFSSHVKTIEFDSNVYVKRPLETVHADHAQIIIPENKCVLTGNVVVMHNKKNDEDVPVTAKSEQAVIDWQTGDVELKGSSQKPVSTTIDLTSKMKILQEKHEEKILRRKEEKRLRKNPSRRTLSLKASANSSRPTLSRATVDTAGRSDYVVK